MKPMLDLTGQKFGEVTLTSFSHVHVTPNGSRKTYWHGTCSCGVSKVFNPGDLKSGNTLSCGCVRREISTSHGLCSHELYSTWKGMIDRTSRVASTSYKYYGGRGIKMCPEWRHSFPTFLKDMGERPEGHSLDRIDNDLGYSKENCRWATAKEQRANQRPKTK